MKTLAHGAFLAAFLALPALSPSAAAKPGFVCKKGISQIEHVICSWGTVGSLDGRMADVFQQALAAQDEPAERKQVQAGQRAWLAERNRRCALDAVKPVPDSEEGLSPKQFGQLLCLQAIYPPRIAALLDSAAAPLVPETVTTLPNEALRAAYPERWQQLPYQARFSPDGSMLVLMVSEVVSDETNQLWLYRLADGKLVAASPLQHRGAPEQPGDISGFGGWLWDNGTLYIRAHRPLGKDMILAANAEGYKELTEVPPAVAQRFEARDVARLAAGRAARATMYGEAEERLNEQSAGPYTAWAVKLGGGALAIKVAEGGGEVRTVARDGWNLEGFELDGVGKRIFYSGEDGLRVVDLTVFATRRLKGTRGGSTETKPLAISADGRLFAYAANSSCTRDAAEAPDLQAEEDTAKRLCLARLPPAEAVVDPWSGAWAGSGEGKLAATIRRGNAKPQFLVIDLVTATEGCSGAVTLYGKPEGRRVTAKSYDAQNPRAPVCTIAFERGADGSLRGETAGDCMSYHGAACGFDGVLTRDKP